MIFELPYRHNRSTMQRTDIEETRISGFAAHRLRADGALAEVITALGGTVHRIALGDFRDSTAAGESVREILAPATPGELRENPWFRGRLLFPFNDRIPHGRYQWSGRTLQLPVNSPEDGSALHGFVYNRPFEPIDEGRTSDGGVFLRLANRIAPEDFPGYPFDVTLEATYRLEARRFTLELSARNSGELTAPLAFGWHPYFTLGQRVDGLRLHANCDEYVPVDAALMPSGELRPVARTDFDFRAGRAIGESALDIALTAPSEGWMVLSSADEQVEVELGGEAFRYVQLFTHPDRMSLAIEPITSATNAFNLPQLGLRTLEAGETVCGHAAITYTRR